MNKRILLTVLIVVMCFMIATPVLASNIKGFGDYYVEETPDGEIVVYIDESNNITEDQDYWKDKLDLLMEQYGRTITFITGVLTITLVIVFIWLCVKVAFLSSEHWIMKRQAMIALLWVGIGTAMMGSAT